MTALPSGWQLLPLGEVADTALGKMLDKARDTGRARVPYLRNLNVQWGQINAEDVATVELSEPELHRFALQPGDLLVCEGGEVGRSALWSGSGYMAYQKALHRVRPRPNLDARFLRYLLEHLHLTGYLASVATGSTIKHLPQERLRVLPVPTPPIEEQRSIVDILEDHLSRLDAATAYVQSAAFALSGLWQSWLSSQSALKSVQLRPLGDVLSAPLRHGKSVPTGDSGFPVLRLTAIKQGRVDLQERKVGAWTASAAKPYLVAAGDFLVARGNGSVRLVGRGGLVGDHPDPVAYPDTAIRVRTDPAQVAPAFLALVWDAHDVRKQIESMARTTAGIHKVNQADLRSVAIPVPSLAKQTELVEAAHEFQRTRQRLHAATQEATRRAEALRRGLLGAAFSGHLTARAIESEEIEKLANG